MTLAEREKHAKTVVNGLRKAVGLRALAKLKRGIPKHSRACTIAMSLHDAESSMGEQPNYCPFWARSEVGDKVLEQFMRDFDKGKYPHLEIPKTPVKIKFPGDRKQTVIE